LSPSPHPTRKVSLKWPILFSFSVSAFLFGTGVRTQGLTLATWVLYHLNHSTSTFLSIKPASSALPIRTFNLLFFFFLFWDRVSHYVAQACQELTTLLPQLPKCWDYMSMPLYPVTVS
jgi:hypothetical protein